ncbi:protoporphyrinogen oxidase [Allomyces macrogynus ATCC 38327]|uniref:Protoporphyrinogen oxidase n=1 Tax=Allomyces macrogynus (strain ATCC 38327) TaxID=578462 RepID=A0A0L0RY54_ALLM3|nr:protoporphyrinogen oxidase [Allomyces macrogynus ATCC 38327]|eukprot:KNE55293.1 protoporphyrinogen oxidase [Allomyces macrogynus ATCC 38327]
MAAAPRIAVVGGGISGLASAYYIKTALPKAKITVLEASPRVGGWIRSTKGQDDGPIVLEEGPRTLRPVGLQGALTLDLIQRAGLQGDVIMIAKDSPSARNRFVLHNDRIEKMPASLASAIIKTWQSSSALHGIVPLALREMMRPPRPLTDKDDTIYDLVSRRFSPELADTLVSAMVHGIYAGNPRQLSVQATFPALVRAEQQYGSVMRGMMRGAGAMSPEDRAELDKLVAARPEFRDLWHRATKSSIYTLQNGLESAVVALAKHLEGMDVHVRTSAPVTRLDAKPYGEFGVQVGVEDTADSVIADHLVCAIPGHAVSRLPSNLPATGSACSRGPNTDPALLGIIYDSAATPRAYPAVEAEVVKFTVMMQGDAFASAQDPSMPDRALAAIRRHLGMPTGVEPVLVRAHLHNACIPQYSVGHMQRLRALRESVGPKVHLVGCGYDGVGVNDCVRSAWETARRIADGI